MRSVKILATLISVVGSAVVAAQSVPYTFTPGSVIRANELNENFRALASTGSSSGATSGGRIRVVDTRTKRVLGVLLDMGLYERGIDVVYSVLTPNNYILLLTSITPVSPSNGADVTTDFSKNITLYFPQDNCAGSPHTPAEENAQLPYLPYNYNNVVISDGAAFRYVRGDRAFNIFEARSYKEPGTGVCKALTGINVSPTNPAGPNTTRFHPLFTIPPEVTDFANIPVNGRIGIELALF